MRFADVFLRLGLCLVSWMVLFGYALWVLILPKLPCTAGETSLWLVLLYATPMLLLFCFLLPTSRALPAVHPSIRWLAPPLALLSAFAFSTIYYAFSEFTFGSGQPCGITSRAWAAVWAPIHSALLLLLLGQLWRIWRAP